MEILKAVGLKKYYIKDSCEVHALYCYLAG